MCVCELYVCWIIWVHMCMHVYRSQKLTLGVFLNYCPLYFWKWVLSLNLAKDNRFGSCPASFWDQSVSICTTVGLQTCDAMPGFLVGSGSCPWVLMFEQQAPHSLRHLFNPLKRFLNNNKGIQKKKKEETRKDKIPSEEKIGGLRQCV